MKLAGPPTSRVNEHGQVYVHVYETEIYIFHLTKGGAPKVIPLPRRTEDATRTSIADGILRKMGWGVGVDGWRAPLDPRLPIVATAHIYPLDEMWRFGS